MMNPNKTSETKELNVRRVSSSPTTGCDKGIVDPAFNENMGGIRAGTGGQIRRAPGVGPKPSQF